MNKLEQIMKATQYNVESGSQHLWDCFGYNARYMDFMSDLKNSDDVSASIIFDTKTQELFVVELFCDEAYRWINPKYLQAYRKECFDKGQDPRIAYDDVYYADCEVWEDILEKVTDAFEKGEVDKRIVVSLNIDEDLSDQLEKMQEITKKPIDLNELVNESLKMVMDRVGTEFYNNWEVLKETLYENEEINLSFKESKSLDKIPLVKEEIESVFNWVVSLNEKNVILKFIDKETEKGLKNILIAECGQTYEYFLTRSDSFKKVIGF